MARFACSLGVSARRACWLCSTTRSALHYRSKQQRRDRHVVRALRIIARHNPAWGYRLAHGLLRLRSWSINQKRVYRLWRLAGLALPPYRPSRKIKTGERLDRKAQTRNDVWAWDFVHDSYAVGHQFRCLTVKDEATAFCLQIEVGTSIRNGDVGAVLKKLIARYGRPKAIRSDNGPELVATELRKCLANEGIDHLRIVPGKPWQNGSNESFNGTFRKECLNAELFGSLMEAQVVIEQWRRRYNQNRPHSNQGYITPEMAYFGHRQL
tara:strand:+ start:153 stop:953 length:801 start_codon:yes stop_codon:yes gene_type:complete